MLIRFSTFWKPSAAEPPGDIALTGSPASVYSSADAATHTLAYTLGASTAGTNRKLIVAAAANPNDLVNNTITCTYNGQSMTSAGSIDTDGESRTHLFYLDDDDLPTDGASHNIVVSIAGDVCFALIGTPGCYINVAQGAPSHTDTDTAGGGAATSITLNSVSEGGLVVDAVASSISTSFTPGGSQTERFDLNGAPPGWTLAGSDQIGVSAGNIVMTQDPGGGPSGHIAVAWAKAA